MGIKMRFNSLTGELVPSNVSDVSVVSSSADMLSLGAQVGDLAIRLDISKTFVLKQEPSSALANWQELLSASASPVSSVNGRQGAVTLNYSDVGAEQAGGDK